MDSIIKELSERRDLLTDHIFQMRSDKGQLLADICTIAKSGQLAFFTTFQEEALRCSNITNKHKREHLLFSFWY